MKGKKVDGYGYLAIVIVSWGIVPAFAKLGNLSGDITTFYVNWIAVGAVALLISIQGKWKLFREYRVRDYISMAGIGLVWPLVYSVAYFESISRSGAAWTTIVNYTWPVFALLFGWLINKSKVNRTSVVGVTFAVAAVAVTSLLENSGKLVALPLIGIGLVAAVSQGFYTSVTDNSKWNYDPWVMTLVVEIVTSVGVVALVVARGTFVVPSLSTFVYLAIIGAISNGIGFWAFLAGSQRSGLLGSRAKGTWLVGMCFVPFAQVLLLPFLGVETVGVWKWLGAGLVTIGLIVTRLGKK